MRVLAKNISIILTLGMTLSSGVSAMQEGQNNAPKRVRAKHAQEQQVQCDTPAQEQQVQCDTPAQEQQVQCASPAPEQQVQCEAPVKETPEQQVQCDTPAQEQQVQCADQSSQQARSKTLYVNQETKCAQCQDHECDCGTPAPGVAPEVPLSANNSECSDSESSSDEEGEAKGHVEIHDGHLQGRVQFVNEGLCNLSKLTKKQLKNMSGRSLNNLIIAGASAKSPFKLGHRKISAGHLRTLKWDKSVVNNVVMRNIKAGAMNAHKANWNGFEITGSILDWEFQGATLHNGRFGGELEGVNFNNSHLSDISFAGAKLADAKRKGMRKTTFKGATLENVSFEHADLNDVSFKDTIFRGNTSFKNSKIDFGTVFSGAKIEVASGQFVLITPKVAAKLQAHYHKATNLSFASNNFREWLRDL